MKKKLSQENQAKLDAVLDSLAGDDQTLLEEMIRPDRPLDLATGKGMINAHFPFDIHSVQGILRAQTLEELRASYQDKGRWKTYRTLWLSDWWPSIKREHRTAIYHHGLSPHWTKGEELIGSNLFGPQADKRASALLSLAIHRELLGDRETVNAARDMAPVKRSFKDGFRNRVEKRTAGEGDELLWRSAFLARWLRHAYVLMTDAEIFDDLRKADYDPKKYSYKKFYADEERQNGIAQVTDARKVMSLHKIAWHTGRRRRS